MNALLPERMFGRQLHIDGYDLANAGKRQIRSGAAPGDQQSAAADIDGVHIGAHPDRRRTYMTPERDVHPRVVSPVNVFHRFEVSTVRNLSLYKIGDQ